MFFNQYLLEMIRIQLLYKAIRAIYSLKKIIFVELSIRAFVLNINLKANGNYISQIIVDSYLLEREWISSAVYSGLF